MPRLFVANLHFEQQLAGDRQTLPVELEDRLAELAAGWLSVCEPDDAIWCPRPIPDRFWTELSERGLPLVRGLTDVADVPAGLELVPWGWSSAMSEFARRIGARSDAPPLSAVVRANSRRFANDLECRWNIGLERAVSVTTQGEIERALRTVHSAERWVLKAEFGSAARQRIIGTGPALDARSAGWIRRRLAAGEWMQFEPWVARIEEAGLQWTVPKAGPPVLAGVTELLTDAAGQYRGSRFGLEVVASDRWQPAIDVARRAVEEIQQLGYFGPVGIDVMRYRDADGNVQLRPLQDINARWTMGRLALGWRRVMPQGTWRHGSVEEFVERQRELPDIVRTSPDVIGDRSARIATWLE